MPKKAKHQPSRSSRDDKRQKRRRSSDSSTEEAVDNFVSWFGSDVFGSVIVSAVLMVMYIRTLHPSLPGGDSGELIISAHEFGVAHPPGYPTFTMLSKLAMLIIPTGKTAWRVNVLNAALSAMAGGLLHLAVFRLTHCLGSSIMAVSLFSLGQLTWTWSVSAEVFGLNNFFIAAMIFFSIQFDSSTEVPLMKKYAKRGALVCGLSLTNQHTAVIYVACIALWVLMRLKYCQVLTSKLLVELGTAFCTGLLPYLYLPVSSFLCIARWTWGDQTSISGFLTHVLRSEYGTFQLGKDQAGLGFTHGVESYCEHVMSEFTILGVILLLCGVFVSSSRAVNKKSTAPFVFVVMVTCYVLFFAWRANLDISNTLLKGVVERFWMQSDMVLALLAGLGFSALINFIISTVFDGSSSIKMILTFVGSAIVLSVHMRNFGKCNQRDNYVVHDFANNLLENFPEDAIVFTKGDLPTNSMRYLHLCEKLRPDLELVDVEVLTYKWSLNKMRKFHTRVKFPGDFWHLTDAQYEDGSTSFSFKSLLDANQRWPMFACIGMQERDLSWQGSYVLWPYGVCHKIVPAHEPMDPTSWASVTGSLADDWIYPIDKFDETSWEKVANDEMWNAKISSAFFMFQEAEKSTDPKIKGQLYYQSYELYFRAIKQHQPSSRLAAEIRFPSFWHKNFALVCERLLRVDHNLDKVVLCKQAISHFKQYVLEARDDPENHKILDAVETLKQRLDMYEKFDHVDKTLDNIAERAEKTAELLNQESLS